MPSGLTALLGVFVLLGVGGFFMLLKGHEPARAWSIYLVNHFYFMSLALGGLFFAALQFLTGAMWSAPVRRVSEAFTAYLPLAVVTTLILFIGMHDLYHWSHDAAVQKDPILLGKSGYLNVSFFMIRQLFALGLWIFFAWKMVGNSIKQDETKDPGLTAKNRAMSPVFLILFSLTYTMVSFDQIMSLDPHWFSTMFGLYCFAGMFYINLASTCLLTIYLKRKGYLDGIINDNHLHDLGKFMFAFTVFWAYIGFSQFMLIWYANLPEETGYFIRRLDNEWFYVSLFLLIGKFMTPFVILLPRDSKRNESILIGVGIFMLMAQFVDNIWMVQPEFFKNTFRFGFGEILVTLGFMGLFGLAVTRFLTKHKLVAINDPRLAESVQRHHQ